MHVRVVLQEIVRDGNEHDSSFRPAAHMRVRDSEKGSHQLQKAMARGCS